MSDGSSTEVSLTHATDKLIENVVVGKTLTGVSVMWMVMFWWVCTHIFSRFHPYCDDK